MPTPGLLIGGWAPMLRCQSPPPRGQPGPSGRPPGGRRPPAHRKREGEGRRRGRRRGGATGQTVGRERHEHPTEEPPTPSPRVHQGAIAGRSQHHPQTPPTIHRPRSSRAQAESHRPPSTPQGGRQASGPHRAAGQNWVTRWKDAPDHHHQSILTRVYLSSWGPRDLCYFKW